MSVCVNSEIFLEVPRVILKYDEFLCAESTASDKNNVYRYVDV